MIKPLIAALPLLALMACATHAQETTFTADDETLLQQCLEAAHASADTAETTEVDPRECISRASNACQNEPGGSSTPAIVTCNMRETAWWDSQLNLSYDQLQETLAATLAADLKTAQRTWLAYRDANCSFAYNLYGDGSMRSIAQSSCMMTMTGDRAIELAGLQAP